MDTFLITKDLGGQAVDSTKIENYMGYDFITGPELVKRFQYQLIHSHYVDHLISDVEKIEPADDGFKVTVSELKDYSAKTLIVASGMTRRKLNVPGEEEFQRKGVFYGNIQDLSFVQGEDAKAAMSARQYMLKRKQKNSITGNNDEVEEEMIRQKIWNRAWNGYRKKNY
ncbi:thioredoxin reductase [bacterium BMS3Abin10]|nr:thioredoxin reductase [bacterium BMS3Abin10]GBE37894.1 thioredoxin reductase [bacterium BMS3Bbin08]